MARPVLIAGRAYQAYRQTVHRLNNLGWLPNVLLRVTVGFMFFSGAVGKFGDIGTFTRMFAGLGIPGAQLVAPATALAELVGGAALMLGLGTRLAGVMLAGVMIGALITDIGPALAQKYPGWWDFCSNLFYSPEWLLVGLLLGLVCVGPGRASIDALINARLAQRGSAAPADA